MKPLSLLRSSRLSELFKDSIAYGISFVYFYYSFIVYCKFRFCKIWVSVTGNDKHAGTREMPLRTVAQALKQAREWRRLSDPAVEGGINIRLERGIYPQDEILFLRPEDSGTEESPTVIEAVEPGKAVLSGGIRVTGWKPVTDFPAGLPEVARGKVWVADAPEIGNRILEFRQLWVNGEKAIRTTWLAPGEMKRILDFDTEK